MANAGFDASTNIVTLIRQDSPEAPIQLPIMRKIDVAHRILDEVVSLRRTRQPLSTASAR
jgi:hypothetical protein